MESLNHFATELLLLEIERLAPGKCVVMGDVDADDAEAIAYVTGVENTTFIVRYFGDEQALRERGLQAQSSWWPARDEEVQSVVIFHAKERLATDLRVASSMEAFPNARERFVLGHNKLGISSVTKRFKGAFQEVDKVGTGRHSAMVRLAKPVEGAEVLAPQDAWWSQWTLDLGDRSVPLYDLPGVFSRGELDAGTRMLIDHAPALRGDDVLDLGCGVGTIGIARALKLESAKVVLVDHDFFAISAARRNVEALGLSDRVSVVYGDIESVRGRRFDSVVTNPPFHQGSEVTTSTTLRWLEKMKEVLRPGGDLTLVANRFLAYADPLDAAFKQVRVLYEDGKFRLWYARQVR